MKKKVEGGGDERGERAASDKNSGVSTDAGGYHHPCMPARDYAAPPAPESGYANPVGKLGIPLGRLHMPKGNPGMAGCWPPALLSPWSPRRWWLESRPRRPRPDSSSRPRVDLGPLLPPLSVCIRRLMALDDTPAPISMSGSSTHMPASIGRPPLPPYGAVNIHLRSASVNLWMGITLIPVA